MKLFFQLCILSFILPIFAAAEFPESDVAPSEITVAVAANMQHPFAALREAFQKDSGIKIKTIVAASGQLTAQIRNGAPFDIFLSADSKYPVALQTSGHAAASPETYALGKLTLWSRMALDSLPALSELNDKAIRTLGIANPDLAPYGLAAIKALENSGIYQHYAPRLVYAQSIAQLNQYIALGTVDAAITAASARAIPQLAARKGYWLEIPASCYPAIHQDVVILKNNPSVAQFYRFLFSPAAQQILLDYGYLLP